jgi:hypothetical protein
VAETMVPTSSIANVAATTLVMTPNRSMAWWGPSFSFAAYVFTVSFMQALLLLRCQVRVVCHRLDSAVSAV